MNPSPHVPPGVARDGALGGDHHRGSSAALAIGAAATGSAALAVDVLGEGHPSHTVALAVLVAAIVIAGKWIAPRFRGVFELLNAAVVAQPALHLAGTWIGHEAGHGGGSGLPHGLLPDGPTAGQIVFSALIVVAVLAIGRITDLAARSVRRRVRWLSRGPAPITHEGVLVCVDRRGSMLRWCGWVLRAALRGPPNAALRTG